MSKRSIDQIMCNADSPSYEGGDEKVILVEDIHHKSEKSRKVMKREELAIESSSPSSISNLTTSFDEETYQSPPFFLNNNSTNSPMNRDWFIPQQDEDGGSTPGSAKSTTSQWTDCTSSSVSSTASSPAVSLPGTPSELPTPTQLSPMTTPPSSTFDSKSDDSYESLSQPLAIAEAPCQVLTGSYSVAIMTPNEYAKSLGKEKNLTCEQVPQPPTLVLGSEYFRLKEEKLNAKDSLNKNTDTDYTPMTSTSIHFSQLQHDTDSFETLESNIESQFNAMKEMLQKLQNEFKELNKKRDETRSNLSIERNMVEKMKIKELTELKKNLSQAMTMVDSEILNRLDCTTK